MECEERDGGEREEGEEPHTSGGPLQGMRVTEWRASEKRGERGRRRETQNRHTTPGVVRNCRG